MQAEERMDSMTNDFPSDDKLERTITFTPKFKKRMNAFFKKLEYKDRFLKLRRKGSKAGIIVAASFVICFSVVSNVDALRVPFFKFFQ